MLVSEHPGAFIEREVGDPWAADSWLAVRDPSGVNPVSLDVMPGSSHDSLSDAGWKVFLDAFPKAAKRG